MNTISSYPLFSGFSGSFLDKILVTYSFQPDLEDFVQHLSDSVYPKHNLAIKSPNQALQRTQNSRAAEFFVRQDEINIITSFA